MSVDDSSQELYLIQETIHDYRIITCTYINTQKFNLDSLYNFIGKKTEVERVVFSDDDPETGFVLGKNLKWSGENVDNLNLQAVVLRRDLHSVRDLSDAELPLLENICEKVGKFVAEKYKLDLNQILMYFDYQPTYYHLHVNVTHIKCGGRDATSIFLHSVINNLHMDAHYYKKATLPFFFKQSHPLYEAFQKSGHIVANIGMKRPSISQHVSALPPKRLLQNLDKSVERPCYSTWFNAVREYMYYFVRNHDQENRVFDIAPSYAVTHAHSQNADLQEPFEIEGKKHPGTTLNYFPSILTTKEKIVKKFLFK